MMSLSLLVVVYSYHSLSLALLEVGVSGVIVAGVCGVAIEPFLKLRNGSAGGVAVVVRVH